MKNVTLANNCCSIGHSSIGGFFNYDDMIFMQNHCHDGWFTPCFYELHEQWPYSWHTQTGILLNMEHAQSQPNFYKRYFYFTFPDNENFLVIMRLKGMKLS